MSPIAQTDWVPERLGRYDIIGELATGGMAQILLAKPSEPGGLKRLLVLKRILPHLADDTAFIEMFHDEARIVSALDHPNVVHVHELEDGKDGMFMVMEFLDGESMFGLMRRLTREKSKLSHDLAIHLVAEACSGLHAAHELRDEHDRPLDLVHRDISPHNLFITYSGKLKVIDFGIAKTEHRITKTETGQLKGKFEYMSPEQCAAQPVDRRADVYALGIVLYELVTGRRLFKRANELLTIRAVTEQPIIPPSELNPECSPELEAVCMRALQRDRDDRYESCAKLRRALLRVLREEHRSPKLPEDQLFELMQDLFPDRIKEKQVLFTRIQDGSAPTKLPKPEVDLQYAVPEISDDELRAHTHTRNVGASATVNKRIKSRPNRSADSSSPHTPDPTALRAVASSHTPSTPGMEAVKAPQPGDSSAGVLSPAAAPTGGEVAKSESKSKRRPPAPVSKRSHIASGVGVFCAVIAMGILGLMWLDDTDQVVIPVAGNTLPQPIPASQPIQATHVSITMTSKPPGAVVTLDGIDRGITPVTIALPRSGAALSYEFKLPGYAVVSDSVIPIADMPVHHVMQKAVAEVDRPPVKLTPAQEARREARRARREQRRLERLGQTTPGSNPLPPPPVIRKPKPKADPFRRFN